MSKAARLKHPSPASLDDMPEVDLKKARLLGRGLRKDRKLPLRALREAAGKTQDELARASGMDQRVRLWDPATGKEEWERR